MPRCEARRRAFRFGDEPGLVVTNWKQAMIVLLALFPVVMLELLHLSPLLRDLDVAVATFIGNLLSVAAPMWMLVPWADRAFDWWPRPTILRAWRPPGSR